MTPTALAYRCALAGIAAGREIRAAVHRMALRERAQPCVSILKPRGNAKADAVAEAVGMRHLERLSAALRHPIKLLADADQPPHVIGASKGTAAIWVSFDAVDGTVKVAGLGNDLRRRKMRAANDGAWAPVMAFTAPTDKQPEDLRVGDFITAAVVDGNPTRYKTYPREIIAVPDRSGRRRTYELAGTRTCRLFTSSNRELAQSFVFLDAFQAYDRETRAAGDEELAVEVYRRLINRHAGGAYDVLRHFGSLSALQRLMLGWHDGSPWYEPQAAAFIVINENLPNLIPALAFAEGAGALCIDFDGRPLRTRRLGAGRTSIVYAANRDILREVTRLIQQARHAIPVSR
jgi:hypothetical protein